MGKSYLSLGPAAANGYHWWIERFRASLALFDMVRLDHFRGFEAIGRFQPERRPLLMDAGSRARGSFLSALQNAFGELPVVAENLGVITPPVENLRQQFGLPGISVLQFAFGN